jgi:hypothetical protein
MATPSRSCQQFTRRDGCPDCALNAACHAAIFTDQDDICNARTALDQAYLETMAASGPA